MAQCAALVWGKNCDAKNHRSGGARRVAKDRGSPEWVDNKEH